MTKKKTQKCAQCGRRLPVAAFGKAPFGRPGLAKRCRECAGKSIASGHRAKKKEQKQGPPIRSAKVGKIEEAPRLTAPHSTQALIDMRPVAASLRQSIPGFVSIVIRSDGSSTLTTRTTTDYPGD